MRSGFLSDSPRQARNRAILKTAGYRALMILITVAVAWVIVGDVRQAIDIGIVANVIKTATYYGYERLWDRITWGIVDDR